MYIFLIFFIKLISINSLLVLPLETLSVDNFIINNHSSHIGIIQKSFFKSLYTIINIGTPIQKIPLFIKINDHSYEITSLTIENTNKNHYKLIYNLSSIFTRYDFFNENKSLTFKTEGCIDNHNMFSDHFEDCHSNDTISFYQDINMLKEIKYENFFFNLVKRKEENITGVIGLGLFDKSEKIEKSFLKVLKREKIINNYNWYFVFDSWNNTNGKLIIGSLPHEDYPDKYSEQDLQFTYIPYQYSSTKIFKIEFNDIYTDSKNKSLNINVLVRNAELAFDTNIIIGPNEFEDKLKELFLNNLILEKKCFKESFKQALHYYSDLNFYYCDISIKETLYEFLSSIKFVSNDLSFIFEITKDELYKIEGNYIYFNILFDYIIRSHWVLGRSFTLKYPFVFNSDSNNIGLYIKYKQNTANNNSELEEQKFNKKNIVLIFIVIVLSVGLIIFGIIIGKKLYGIKRKIKANELYDNYEYISEENSNKDINKNIEKNKYNKDYSNPIIEMKINI